MRFIYFVLAVVLFFGACQFSQKKNSKKFLVVSTTNMIHDLVQDIGGDFVKAKCLMGPGIDPHFYQPTQEDLIALRKADIVFHNGLHLEGKMASIFAQLKKSRVVVAVSEQIETSQLIFLKGNPPTPDPHIWFDIKLWMQAAEQVASTLKKQLPNHAKDIQKNLEKKLFAMQKLDNWVKRMVKQVPKNKRVLITSHDAFSYFGRAYGFEVKGLQGISTTAEYGIYDIKKMVKYIVVNKIPAVFVETSVSPRALKAVAEGVQEKGHKVSIGGKLYSDAMGASNTPEGTYEGMIKYNTNTIVLALK